MYDDGVAEVVAEAAKAKATADDDDLPLQYRMINVDANPKNTVMQFMALVENDADLEAQSNNGVMY